MLQDLPWSVSGRKNGLAGYPLGTAIGQLITWMAFKAKHKKLNLEQGSAPRSTKSHWKQQAGRKPPTRHTKP